MATVSTPVRQPFGVLSESKLRGLQSIKNRQNALTPSSAPTLKRRAPSPELSDAENVDPSFFDSGSKRKRASLEDDVTIAKKQPRLYTQIIPPTTRTCIPPSTKVLTPRVEPTVKTTSTPLSAPAAAGRSPTRLGSKYDKTQSRRRFVPPSLGTTSPNISIASVLKGTLAHKKSARTKKSATTLSESKPKSWFFDIYEESEEVQDYRMNEWTMTQSSAALEISDDESRSNSFNGKERLDRGKENVDPNEMFVSSGPVTRAATAAAAAAFEDTEAAEDKMKTEEPRTPLGDLNATEFYGEGLDATSVVLVHDDVPHAEIIQEQEAPVADASEHNSTAQDFTFEVPLQTQSESNILTEKIPEWAQQTTLNLEAQAPEQDPLVIPLPDGDSADIEIWESESAKDENEQQEEQQPHSNCVVVEAGQTISLSGAYLQES